MKKIRDYTIRAKLLTAFVGLAAVPALMTGGNALFNIPYHGNYEQILSAHQKLAVVLDIVTTTKQKEVIVERYLHAQRTADQQAYSSLSKLQPSNQFDEVAQTPEETEIIQKIIEANHQLDTLQALIMTTATAGDATKAKTLAADDLYATWNSYFDSLTSRLAHLENDQIATLTAQNRQLYVYIWATVVATLLVTTLAGVTAAYLLSRFIVKPLLAIEKATLQISNGDLDVRIQPQSQDEIGRLGVAFNKMAVVLARQNKQKDLKRITKEIES